LATFKSVHIKKLIESGLLPEAIIVSTSDLIFVSIFSLWIEHAKATIFVEICPRKVVLLID